MHSQTQKTRDYLFDNLKGIGIILVVLGHVIEQIQTPLATTLYKLIYLFHMPLFVFISGFFAKYDIKKIITKLLIPFLIFQSIYILFEVFILNSKVSLSYFLTPRWILWYLFAMVIWRFSICFIEKAKKYLIPLIIFFVIAGLLIGFIPFDGYIFSVSRIIVFYPFFLLGYYFRQKALLEKKIFSNKIFKTVIAFCAIATLVIFFFIFPQASKASLYGSVSYCYNQYNSILIRLYVYLCATIIIITLFSLMTNQKTFISFVGKNSFVIYIAHAPIATFLSDWLAKTSVQFPVLICIIITIILISIICYGIIFYKFIVNKYRNKIKS